MPLGEVKRTQRGFEIIEFQDIYGETCSLQQSSKMGDNGEEPGAAAIWLGPSDPKPQVMVRDAIKLGVKKANDFEEIAGWTDFPLPGEVSIHSRMHLNREKVEALIQHLQSWLEYESFTPPSTGIVTRVGEVTDAEIDKSILNHCKASAEQNADHNQGHLRQVESLEEVGEIAAKSAKRMLAALKDTKHLGNP